MAIYSQTALTTVLTTGVPAWDVKASSVNSPRVMEIGLSLGAATASTYGLGRPANDGSVAQTTPVLLNAENPNDPASQTGTAVAWGTAPTIPTIFLRRVATVAAITGGVLWTFPRGLACAVSKGLVVWNLATNSASLHVWIVVDE